MAWTIRGFARRFDIHRFPQKDNGAILTAGFGAPFPTERTHRTLAYEFAFILLNGGRGKIPYRPAEIEKVGFKLQRLPLTRTWSSPRVV